MSSHQSISVTLTDLSFQWPDGSVALSEVSGSFGIGKTGLVGANGSGKSTLLKLITGLLTPTSGSIQVSQTVGYLPQDLTSRVTSTVADLLGISTKLSALKAIAAGDSDLHHFETVGDDWDIEDRANDSLRQIGFAGLDLDRPVSALSGGETILIAVLGLQVRRSPITLLDEPSNNLDRTSRRRLAGLIRTWPGTLIVVSHSAEILDLMDETVELYQDQLTTFGGPFSQWLAYLDQQQSAAVQAERSAAQAVKVEKRQRIAEETKIARRVRAGRKSAENKVAPKIVMNQWASNAQVSAAKSRSTAQSKVAQAQAHLDEVSARVRDRGTVRLDLPDPGVPRAKRIAEIRAANATVVIQGPERIAITGDNGVGKTTLLEHLVNGRNRVENRVHGTLFTKRVGYLPQRLDILDDQLSAIANVQTTANTVSASTIRNQLALFMLRGDSVMRPVHTLSGGERFRVCLARLLLADPASQLIVLDEPTNNLDRQTVDQLIDAVNSYRGAVIVSSHDDDFLSKLELDDMLALDRNGNLWQIALDGQSANS